MIGKRKSLCRRWIAQIPVPSGVDRAWVTSLAAGQADRILRAGFCAPGLGEWLAPRPPLL
jgi:hypothetical protein